MVFLKRILIIMNFLAYKSIFLGFSGLLVFLSIVVLAFWGLNLGIDFTGGSLLEIEFENVRPPNAEIQRTLEPLGLGVVSLQPTGERGVLLRFRHIDEATHQMLLSRFPKMQEKRFDTIGPTIGKELKNRAFIALGVAVIAIILYIAWAFRAVSKPVVSWKYGVAAVIALIHDIIIPAGVFSFLGHFYGVEVDALFITALLTILGFSVHDTIVVFDRIREHLRMSKGAEVFAEILNRSVHETVTRSVNTSLTVLLVLFAIVLAGGATTRFFAVALILGVVFGTYSSLFVATPLLTFFMPRDSRQHR